MMSYRALSPGPSPSGGGCRPQGRRESENVAGPRCGNDRSRGDMRTVLPSAGGHVLPLPSSASRGIGGCHLPPLGEGNGGCEFAERGGLTLVLLRDRPRAGRRALQGNAADSPEGVFVGRIRCGTSWTTFPTRRHWGRERRIRTNACRMWTFLLSFPCTVPLSR